VSRVIAVEECLATTFGHPPAHVRVELQRFDRPARLRRAAQLALPLYALGVLMLPIPPHFVNLVALWTAATGLGLRRLREHTLARSLAGPCPACRREQAFETPRGGRLPAVLRCPGCGEFVKIHAAPTDLR
jgi:hypothetical protein